MLLGLDIATKTGYAFGGPSNGSPRTGVWQLPKLDLDLDRALLVLHDSVFELSRLIKAEVVFIEAPLLMMDRQAAAQTAMSLISLAAVARCAAKRAGAAVRLVHVQTVRKHFVGVGRPDNPKRVVQDRCKLLGWPFEDDNAADACATWSYGMATIYPRWSPRSTPLFARAGAA